MNCHTKNNRFCTDLFHIITLENNIKVTNNAHIKSLKSLFMDYLSKFTKYIKLLMVHPNYVDIFSYRDPLRILGFAKKLQVIHTVIFFSHKEVCLLISNSINSALLLCVLSGRGREVRLF